MLKAVEGLFIKLFIHYKAYLYRPLDYRLALHTHTPHMHHTHTVYSDLTGQKCVHSSVLLFVCTCYYTACIHVCVCSFFSVARVNMKELVWAGIVDAGHPLVKCARAELAVCVCVASMCVRVCGRAWLHALVSCSPFGWTSTTTAG